MGCKGDLAITVQSIIRTVEQSTRININVVLTLGTTSIKSKETNKSTKNNHKGAKKDGIYHRKRRSFDNR